MATKSKSTAKTDVPEVPPAVRGPASPAGDENKVSPAPSRNARGQSQETVSEDEFRIMIEREAYLRAERRGFEPGHEEEDWLAAEAQVRSTLRGAGPQKH